MTSNASTASPVTPSPAEPTRATLCRGWEFANRVATLVDVRDICRVTIRPDTPTRPEECFLVSDTRSPFPVWATWDRRTSTLHLVTPADELALNGTSGAMFRGFSSLLDVDLGDVDASNVWDGAAGMFDGCDRLDPDVREGILAGISQDSGR